VNLLSRLLRTVSVLACLLVVASFSLFVVDQTSSASAHQVAELGPAAQTGPLLGASGADPAPAHPSTRPGGLRRSLDDASSALTSPFRSLLSSGANIWLREGLPTLLALAAYGLGLGFLARFVRIRS
jgi:hypothetical protein